MNKREQDLFKEYPNTRVMFKDSTNNVFWPAWKAWKDCTPEEQNKANLREIFPPEIVLDLEEKPRYEEIKEELDNEELGYRAYDTGSKGVHFHLEFADMPLDNEEYRKEIRKLFIEQYKCDLAKASEKTLISISDRPHHKTMKPKSIIAKSENFNTLQPLMIQNAINKCTKKENNKIVIKDEEFTNFHIKDPFFKYISNNVLKDDTARNDVVFPNLAIALVKEGLTETHIESIMKPIISKNFPGKNYNEFKGWLTKAFNGSISTYNPIQVNKWMDQFTKTGKVYDLKEIEDDPLMVDLDQLEEGEDKKIEFHWDKDLDKLKFDKIEWLIEDWIPKGDICFIAGKAASFKSTACMHFGFALAEGKLIFNKYNSMKSKVLYVNEENSGAIALNIIKRVKNGLDMEDSKSNNIAFTILQNIRFDEREGVNQLVDFVNKNKIEVVVFDSFRRFFLGEENDATMMNKIFNFLKWFRSKTNTTILILHHLKKDNARAPSDLRDLLRGSSDIVNSADSVIGIHRKHGCNAFQMEHIKNRAGMEMSKKLILVDAGDNEDKAYMYESKDLKESEKAMSAPEKCAEMIISHVASEKLSVFTKKNLENMPSEYKNNTIVSALKILENEGTISASGNGPTRSYAYHDTVKN